MLNNIRFAWFQLENGARPCIKCDNGFFPINVAGKCASAKTLEVLIQHGKLSNGQHIRRCISLSPIAEMLSFWPFSAWIVEKPCNILATSANPVIGSSSTLSKFVLNKDEV